MCLCLGRGNGVSQARRTHANKKVTIVQRKIILFFQSARRKVHERKKQQTGKDNRSEVSRGVSKILKKLGKIIDRVMCNEQLCLFLKRAS